MTRRLRQFLVFQAFLVWQGGFVFYAGVVVPIGTDVLGSPLDQGLVTQQVTDWLNLIGLGWHAVFAWELLAGGDPVRRRTRWRATLWAISLLLLGGLVVCHRELDAHIIDGRIPQVHKSAFRVTHIVYLWLITGQWALALVNAWLTLGAWSAPRPLESA